MAALTRFVSFSKSRCSPLASLVARNISTSKKKQETAAVNPSISESTPVKPAEEKNWISYGFSFEDKEEDRHYMHGITFLVVSVIFVGGAFVLAYKPDSMGRDWARREAFLELRRREKLGLPLIDPNYLPLDQIILPTDEELGDTEIVV